MDLSAHRRDEFLQAARIGIDAGAIDLELNLTPGIELAETIVADIDRDRDGALSQGEQRAYGSLVLSALTIEVDGTPVPARLTGVTFPDVDAVKRGEGTIRMQLAGTLPRLSPGPHQLVFRNRHYPNRSVYLTNALVPVTADVTVTAQRRDPEQTELTIDYLLRTAPAPLAPAWLIGGLAVTVLFSGLLIRPLRSLRS